MSTKKSDSLTSLILDRENPKKEEEMKEIPSFRKQEYEEIANMNGFWYHRKRKILLITNDFFSSFRKSEVPSNSWMNGGDGDADPDGIDPIVAIEIAFDRVCGEKIACKISNEIKCGYELPVADREMAIEIADAVIDIVNADIIATEKFLNPLYQGENKHPGYGGHPDEDEGDEAFDELNTLSKYFFLGFVFLGFVFLVMTIWENWENF